MKKKLHEQPQCVPKCSLVLYEMKDFHQKAQNSLRTRKAGYKLGSTEVRLFRNHMRKVTGRESSMSEFSEHLMRSWSLWEGQKTIVG